MRCLALPAFLCLAACTVGPDFIHPDPPAVPEFRDSSVREGKVVSLASNPDPKWWAGFNDPALSDLVNRAIAGNLDLQQAILRVVEARQGIVTARAQGLPMLNGTASYMREQLGVRGLLESSGAYRELNTLADQNSPLNAYQSGLGTSVGNAAGGLLNQATQPINLFQYGLDASWQLDLFGRVGRNVESARARTEAQQESANDTLVMLESDVAQNYLQLRGAQTLLATQRENVKIAQDALDLTNRRSAQGLATQLDVEQARTQLETTQEQLPQYERQLQQSINRLNILVGQPPGTLDDTLSTSAPLPAPPAMINVGVPSTLARRRPDIRQAEAQLHAATANVGVAVAAFYPDIALTGSLGIRATDASYLTNWASHFYSVGPSVSLPIFRGGSLTGNLRLARAQEAEAAVSYRSTVLNALREVEDALVAFRTDRAARERQAAAVQSAETTLYLSQQRYTHGLSDFLQVLDSERTLTSARQQLAQQDVTLTTDVVALYRALGGGWEATAGDVPVPPVNNAPPPVPAALDSLGAGVKP